MTYLEIVNMVAGWAALGLGITWMFMVNRQLDQLSRVYKKLAEEHNQLVEGWEHNFTGNEQVRQYLNKKFPGWVAEAPRKNVHEIIGA